MILITIVTGVYKPIKITGGPHIVGNPHKSFLWVNPMYNMYTARVGSVPDCGCQVQGGHGFSPVYQSLEKHPLTIYIYVYIYIYIHIMYNIYICIHNYMIIICIHHMF